MGCCKSFTHLFQPKKLDFRAEEGLNKTLREASEASVITDKPAALTAHSTTVRPKTPGTFSSVIAKEEIPDCDKRVQVGSTQVGAATVIVYDCLHFNMKVHKNHCLKCPLVDIKKTGSP